MYSFIETNIPANVLRQIKEEIDAKAKEHRISPRAMILCDCRRFNIVNGITTRERELLTLNNQDRTNFVYGEVTSGMKRSGFTT